MIARTKPSRIRNGRAGSNPFARVGPRGARAGSVEWRRVARRGERIDLAGHAQELLPEDVGVLPEYGVRVGIEDEPQAAVDLASELAGPPADVAHVIPGLVRTLLDDLVDGVDVDREVEVRHDQERTGAGAPVAAYDRDERAGRERTAEEDRLSDFLGRLVLREQTRERAPCRLVDDDADVTAGRRGRYDQHRLAILGIAE